MLSHDLYRELRNTFILSKCDTQNRVEAARRFGLFLAGYLRKDMTLNDFEKIWEILEKIKIPA